MWAIIAAAVYTCTMSLGITAFFTKRRFGKWHHILFFLSSLSCIAAVILEREPLYTIPAVALILMPFTRAGSRLHAIIGSLGWIAWVVVLSEYYLGLGL